MVQVYYAQPSMLGPIAGALAQLPAGIAASKYRAAATDRENALAKLKAQESMLGMQGTQQDMAIKAFQQQLLQKGVGAIADLGLSPIELASVYAALGQGHDMPGISKTRAEIEATNALTQHRGLQSQGQQIQNQFDQRNNPYLLQQSRFGALKGAQEYEQANTMNPLLVEQQQGANLEQQLKNQLAQDSNPYKVQQEYWNANKGAQELYQSNQMDPLLIQQQQAVNQEQQLKNQLAQDSNPYKVQQEYWNATKGAQEVHQSNQMNPLLVQQQQITNRQGVGEADSAIQKALSDAAAAQVAQQTVPFKVTAEGQAINRERIEQENLMRTGAKTEQESFKIHQEAVEQQNKNRHGGIEVDSSTSALSPENRAQMEMLIPEFDTDGNPTGNYVTNPMTGEAETTLSPEMSSSLATFQQLAREKAMDPSLPFEQRQVFQQIAENANIALPYWEKWHRLQNVGQFDKEAALARSQGSLRGAAENAFNTAAGIAGDQRRVGRESSSDRSQPPIPTLGEYYEQYMVSPSPQGPQTVTMRDVAEKAQEWGVDVQTALEYLKQQGVQVSGMMAR